MSAAVFDYSGIAATAQTLIVKFGRNATLKVASKTLVVAAKPWGAVQSDTVATDDVSVTAKVVFVKLEREDKVDTTTSKRRARVFAEVTALGTNLVDDTWRLVDGVTDYEVVRATLVKPGDTLLVYDLLLEI